MWWCRGVNFALTGRGPRQGRLDVMGRAARNRRQAASATLHEDLGTEPATSLAPVGAPAVRRVATTVGVSAVERVVASLAGGHGLLALQALPAVQAAVDVLTRQAVALAREQGSTWQEIADVFGTTRQAAWQRWGR